MTQTTNAICVGNPMVLSLDIYIFVIVSDFVFQIVSCHGGIDRKSLVFDRAELSSLRSQLE